MSCLFNPFQFYSVPINSKRDYSGPEIPEIFMAGNKEKVNAAI